MPVVIALTLSGSVYGFLPIRGEADIQILEKVTAALSRHPACAPLLGNSLLQYRAGPDGTCNVSDSDFLMQLLKLPAVVRARLLEETGISEDVIVQLLTRLNHKIM